MKAKLLALCLLLAALPTIVLAEKGDRDKPINVEADRVSIDDIKKVQIRTDVSSSGSKVGEFKVDPWLIGVGIGRRF